ncbi:hypothetical protein I8J29_01105 [Paenibacillus sp. MWE-103]|uniref:Uncharacterized protein n=1 Tax=Paenibacillus artemisiicola TaxID=1172618 RepID=A0ABS3W390_9BACL|nr:hypothetical protein [Paenibacillus artemisiicola]MBO7742774.1 hypothetical protein [Paenibacillus artemisiicola]
MNKTPTIGLAFFKRRRHSTNANHRVGVLSLLADAAFGMAGADSRTATVLRAQASSM